MGQRMARTAAAYVYVGRRAKQGGVAPAWLREEEVRRAWLEFWPVCVGYDSFVWGWMDSASELNE